MTFFCASTVLVTSAIVALKAGSFVLAVLLWMSTISPDFLGKPALARIVSAWRLSPSSFLASVGFC